MSEYVIPATGSNVAMNAGNAIASTQRITMETQGEVKEMKASHDQIVNVLKSIDENTKTLRTGGIPQ